MDLQGNAGGYEKPILEIVTTVTSVHVTKNNTYIEDVETSYGQARIRVRRSPRNASKAGNVERTAMNINSPYLVNALRAVVEYYPRRSCSQPLLETQARVNPSPDHFAGDHVQIKAPYHVLVHHRSALAHFRDHQPATHDEEYASITARHIDVLLGFLEKTLGRQLAEEERRNSSSSGPKTIFANLWMLFKPGDVVYAKLDGNWTPFVVSKCDDGTHGLDSKDHCDPCKFDCWNIVYRDGKLRRAFYTFEIPFFTGEDAISKLPVVPLRFHEGNTDGSMVRKEIELGRATWELAKKPTYKSYDGTILHPRSEDDFNHPTSTAGYVSVPPLTQGGVSLGDSLPSWRKDDAAANTSSRNLDERSRHHRL